MKYGVKQDSAGNNKYEQKYFVYQNVWNEFFNYNDSYRDFNTKKLILRST